MISIGQNIRQAADPLQRIPVSELYELIRSPKPDVASTLGQLKLVREMSEDKYRQLKTQLPYCVCAIFDPPCRRTENFAYTEYFIIDIDHIRQRGLVFEDVRTLIDSDPRTLLSFVSPGGDGLKVMMRLSERCYDAGLYRTFYKLFVSRLSRQYALNQTVDSKTCDVARACFLSMDTHVHYNPDAERVVMADFIDPTFNPDEAFGLKRQADKASKEGDKKQREERQPEPAPDIMKRIRETLNPDLAKKPERMPPHVPIVLEELLQPLYDFMEERDVSITDVVNIQYGKKLRFRIGNHDAEINLFYGKRGFSVVQSPRTGTHPEANELAAELVWTFLNTRDYTTPF